MRSRGSAALVGCLLFVTGPAGAVVRGASDRIAAQSLTAMPSAHVKKPLRIERQLRWSSPATPAWQKLASSGSWQAAWDRATGVPSRIWGSGIPAPGAIASPQIAEQRARAALAEHIALLAPGASPSDFELVSNLYDGNIRLVGFLQKHDGRIVVGGQVSFRFKRDRLFMIGSEALPDVTLPDLPRARMSGAAFHDRAATRLRDELALPAAPVGPPGDEVVLPLVSDDAVLGYRLAVPVTVDGGAAGRYLAYSDPVTGETLAIRQMNLFEAGSGTVLYHAVDRYPAQPRVDRPAPLAHVTVGGVAETTSAAGAVTLADGNQQLVTTSVVGDLVAIVNKASGGMLATAQLLLAPSGQIVWDPSATPEDDAQVQTYLNVNTAKEHARSLDPKMPGLDAQIVANVNLAQDCNAFFDGTTLNFFHASKDCQNTGLIQDVVFHEYGHAVHTAEIEVGGGAFDGAMSEGAADFFAAQITKDPRMGRGFFFTDEPLRDLDPENMENRWPEDIGEIHKTGMIFGGTFWDLRKALIADAEANGLDESVGIQITDQLYLGALRRSINIPTSLLEVLATDDDDGDLTNGTPHECAIRDAYGRHGLRTVTGVVAAPDHLEQPTRAAAVHVELSGLSKRCPGDAIDHVDVSWKPAGASKLAAGFVTATQASEDPSKFTAEIPLAADDTLLYQVRVVFTDSSVLTLPDNLADPYYQLYQGRTVPLYCMSFEDADPMSSGWTTGARDGSQSPWTWGVPMTGATDPHAAFSGSHALIQVLDGDYAPRSSSFVRMPALEIGQWSDVHLQFRRWLAVEDSHYDQARIMVGDQAAWINFTQNAGDASSAHHIDREWRFQDVPVSGFQNGHTLDISWDLTSDEGLQFGGWALDDVCVVANVNGVCGDGVVTAHEGCDDGPGNGERPNACRTWCQPPACGDGIVDDGEQCDSGPAGNGECTSTCELVQPPSLGGCCAAGRGAGGSGVLALLTLGLVRRRRRR